VPDSAYEAAERRYLDLGEWLRNHDKAICASFEPHVFPQGSFRLGTVIKPWKQDEFDLDLSCKLQEGLSKSKHTQKDVKHFLGADLESYRQERGIIEPPEEKHRCWRLNYQDDLSFHMDIVPAIPETENFREALLQEMVIKGTEEDLAWNVSQHVVSITDNQHQHYASITSDWPVSNQEGYAVWFESRMRQAQKFLESRAAIEKVAKIDNLPAHRWKTPLQRSIQILKRHRDMMFENDQDNKPISIIITTLAALAYQGEAEIESSLSSLLQRMAMFVNQKAPKIPNPVNLREDFADKWSLAPILENNFWRWLEQAKEDFSRLSNRANIRLIAETALTSFGAHVDASKLHKVDGLLEIAGIINDGKAFTSPEGTISSSGVKNKPHKFHD